jgi:indolepyruvate ferredoxin oxidoreductase alpha subunit
MARLISGNQAVAYAALEAGIGLASGYPGTPSTGALSELLDFAGGNTPAPRVSWSVNEKVAFEIACAASWAGLRALVTMKMSGANVAADSILSAAYSGARGGLVIYIADDPGAEAGMAEQDTRLFAQLAGLPVLEPESPRRAYELTLFAFELSERIELPVIVRSVTSVAHALSEVVVEGGYRKRDSKPVFERDIRRYTKAGAAICLAQHALLLERLDRAEEIIRKAKINRSDTVPGSERPARFALSAGVLNTYLDELLPEFPGVYGARLEATHPLDEHFVSALLDQAGELVIFEELEPFVETQVRALAARRGWQGRILGKQDGLLPRVGRYGSEVLRAGLRALAAEKNSGSRAGAAAPVAGERTVARHAPGAAGPAAPPPVTHPITFCAGCPHRGTYMALNRAFKQAGLDRNKHVVTGDIGCTILGMNPPLDSCWTELSMGASVGLAMGFARSGCDTPVVATIGDSTFFHAGIAPLIDAVQHRDDLLLIILDNGWTSMTGFQVNPGTDAALQPPAQRRVDLAALVGALGVDSLEIIDPFCQPQAVETLAEALGQPGVRVVISRQECALPAARRGERRPRLRVDPERCRFCRACLRESGCPALAVSEGGGKQVMTISAEQCSGCGLCAGVCRFDAISVVEGVSNG